MALGNRCESDVTDNFDLTFDESLDITFKMLNQFDQIQIFVPRGMEMMIMIPWAIQLGFQMMRDRSN